MAQPGLLFPHDELNGNEVMIDYLEDNRRRLKQAMAEMDELSLHWQPTPTSNSIAVTIWHMGRLMDVFLTQLVQGESSTKEQWFSQGWVERTGYNPSGLGKEGWGSVNGYTAEQVAAIPRLTKEQLLGHLDEVYDSMRAFIEATPMRDLTEPAPGLGGHYTKFQVLSMVLIDNVRHLGEIYTLQALWERG